MDKFLLSFLSLLFPILGLAQRISNEEAASIASQVLGKQVVMAEENKSAKSPAYNGTVTHEPSYRIFLGDDGKGFVIVSTDRRAPQVIGYGDGECKPANLPPQLRAILEKQDSVLDAGALMAEHPSWKNAKNNASINYPTIEPMIKTKWNQGYPYNLKTPEFEGQHTTTGCVVTAIAQIMNYWQYPDRLPMFDAELPEKAIDWSAMKVEYGENDNAEEVASLMRYLGESFVIEYRLDGSSGNINDDIITKFGYNKFMRYYSRSQFSNAEWIKLINIELIEGRPVYYGGDKGQVGHAFVLDGCDGNGFYHINWGWSGYEDGYYALTDLLGYTTSQTMAIGFTPQPVVPFIEGEIRVHNYDEYPLTSWFMGLMGFPYFEDICGDYSQKFFLLDDNGQLSETSFERFATSEQILNILPNDGTYKIVSAIKLADDEQWRNICHDYNYIEAIKTGNSLSLADSRYKYNEEKLDVKFNLIGEAKVNSSPQLEVTFTNIGQKDVNGSYLFYSAETPSGIMNTSLLTGAFSLYLSPGESTTKTYELSDWFELTEPGQYGVELYNDNSRTSSKTEVWDGRFEESICEYYFTIADEDGIRLPICEAPIYEIDKNTISGTSATEDATCHFIAYPERRGSSEIYHSYAIEGLNLGAIIGSHLEVKIYAEKQGISRSEIKKERLKWGAAYLNLTDFDGTIFDTPFDINIDNDGVMNISYALTDNIITFFYYTDYEIETFSPTGTQICARIPMAFIVEPDGLPAKTITGRLTLVVEEEITVDKITIDTGDLIKMHKNEEFSIQSTIYPSNAVNKTITWHSDNPDVATVDENGNVVAHSLGTALIKATCGNAYDICRISVQRKNQKIIWSQEFVDVKVGDKIELTAFTTSNLEGYYDILQGNGYFTASQTYEKSGNVFGNAAIYILSPGEFTIKAICNGNDDYLEAEPVIKHFIVNETSVQLTDGEAYEATEDQFGVDINYTRSFDNTEWQPLYVPFNMSYEEWADKADVAEVHNVRGFDNDNDGVIDETVIEFNKLNSGEITPNVPYVIKAKNTGEVTFECTGKNLLAAPAQEGTIECSSTKMTYSFHGVYQPKTDMRSSGAYHLSGGAFHQTTTDDAVLPPNRFYLMVTPKTGGYNPVSAPQMIRMKVNGDDTATSIEGIEVDIVDDGIYYDLMGRKVVNPAKGIYIQNGKKVFVK